MCFCIISFAVVDGIKLSQYVVIVIAHMWNRNHIIIVITYDIDVVTTLNETF